MMDSGEVLDFTPQCPHLRWLCNHLSGWQFGEQGLLVAIADALGVVNHKHVEIGAGDGDALPLTLDRFYDESALLLLYEMDEQKCDKLRMSYESAAICGKYTGQDLPNDVGVCVIDVDSVDSCIMQQVMQRDKPSVVMCEHMDRNFAIATSAAVRIPTWMMGLKLKSGHAIQDTAETLHAIALNHDYERVGLNRCNSIFVRSDCYTKLFR